MSSGDQNRCPAPRSARQNPCNQRGLPIQGQAGHNPLQRTQEGSCYHAGDRCLPRRDHRALPNGVSYVGHSHRASINREKIYMSVSRRAILRRGQMQPKRNSKLKGMLIDSHCHLDDYEDLPQMLAAARAAGVSQLLAIWESWRPTRAASPSARSGWTITTSTTPTRSFNKPPSSLK